MIEYIIASYPRSGNHLVRYIVEYVTSRPTIGEGDDLHRKKSDRCMYERFNIEINNHDPIARKKHWLYHRDECDYDYDPETCAEKFLLILRNPIESILSHNDFKLQDVIDSKVEKCLLENIDWYMHLIDGYNKCKSEKIITFYEDLIENYKQEIVKISSFFNGNQEKTNKLLQEYDFHKSTCLNFYTEFRGSNTKGVIGFYSDKVSTRIKREFFNFIRVKYGTLINYIDRYNL